MSSCPAPNSIHQDPFEEHHKFSESRGDDGSEHCGSLMEASVGGLWGKLCHDFFVAYCLIEFVILRHSTGIDSWGWLINILRVFDELDDLYKLEFMSLTSELCRLKLSSCL